MKRAVKYQLKYQGSSISSIRALSGVLQINETLLRYVAKSRDTYYSQNTPKLKPSGKTRITYSISEPLKFIQKRINKNIFSKVYYPAYLQGSIGDAVIPRTYDNDARIHAGARVIISEDVSNYFHSISAAHVERMWKHLFRCPAEVAALLTTLTTYSEFVPQGSPSSPYIANLILWNEEPRVVQRAEELGFVYTRYIDDLTISTQMRDVPKSSIEEIIRIVHSMLAAKGVKINRDKHQIATRSVPMLVHKLNVNSGKPTVRKNKRNNIRLEVFNLEKEFSHLRGTSDPHYLARFQSVSGKVRELAKFHPKLGRRLQQKLRACQQK